MAQLIEGFSFTGSLGNVSAYKMRGSDKIILRTKGGPSKSQIKKSANFAVTRRNNSEWAACTKASQAFRAAIFPLRSLADFNISGPINGIAKIAQKLDVVNEHGRRAVCFTKNKGLFEGFNLNKNRLFDAVVQVPISVELDRNTKSASLSVPAIWPSIQLDNSYNYNFCRFVFVLGVVSDVVYDESSKHYVLEHPAAAGTKVQYGLWQSAKQQIAPQRLDVCIEGDLVLEHCDTLVLGVGIEFGMEMSGGLVQAIKYSGSAKLVCLG